MSSLRSRLMLGMALAAVLPLAIAMFFLSQRIQSAVRAQASERLAATLAVLEGQLRLEGDQIAEKVAILAEDPTLRRLYLVRSDEAGALDDDLAEKRFLLGLDFLVVADVHGDLVADGARSRTALLRGDRTPPPMPAGGHQGADGVTIEAIPGVPALAMDARAPIVYRNERAGLVRGGLLLDAARLRELERSSGIDLVLRDAGGAVVASTRDRDEAPAADSAASGWLSRRIDLGSGPPPRPTITGIASTAAADQAIAALRLTSLLLGLAGVIVAIVLGWMWSAQVSRPVERLASFSERIARGEWDEPLALHSMRELQTLVTALDRMRNDLRDYRERLVASERQAAWSQMARKVAHEVKNPLTPIAVSIADLKRSHDLGRPDFPAILEQAVATIGEEVEALKRMLQEFSDLGRFPPPQFAVCSLRELLADLETLYRREGDAGRLTLSAPPRDVTVTADRAQLRQALVNLVKNGLEAAADTRVNVTARAGDGHLEIAVADDGPGMSPEQKAQLFVPNFTTKTHGSGLGLTIVERIVSDHRGTIAVASEPGRGTTFTIRLPIEEGHTRAIDPDRR